jgi:NarL family two-component system response regulator LiaR
MSPIKVALVDDHRMVSASLKTYLESFPDFEVAGIAASGEDLLEKLGAWAPAVVLVDLLMPGGLDGVETTRRIAAKQPEVRVIALTASTDEARMTGVLRAGAAGYVRKDAEPEVLLAAVRAVAAGGTYIDPAVRRDLFAPAPRFAALTPREHDVLARLARGEANKAIAAALGIAEETVKTHVAHVLDKLGVDNRAQAVVLAVKQGIGD